MTLGDGPKMLPIGVNGFRNKFSYTLKDHSLGKDLYGLQTAKITPRGFITYDLKI